MYSLSGGEEVESVSYKVANFLGQSHSLFSFQLEPWMGREETQNQSFIVFVFLSVRDTLGELAFVAEKSRNFAPIPECAPGPN